MRTALILQVAQYFGQLFWSTGLLNVYQLDRIQHLDHKQIRELTEVIMDKPIEINTLRSSSITVKHL